MVVDGEKEREREREKTTILSKYILPVRLD